MVAMRYFLQLAALVSIVLVSASSSPAAAPATQPTTKPANKVAFVLDCSGSMLNNFAETRQHLADAISTMPAGRQFVVFIDIESGLVRYPASGYATANETTTAEAAALVAKALARGNEATENAMKLACSIRPDVVWLVTDTYIGTSKGDVIGRLIATAKANRVRINTSFITVDSGSTDAEKSLLRLAKETGGNCYDRKGQPVTDVAEPEKKKASKPFKPSGKKSVFTEN